MTAFDFGNPSMFAGLDDDGNDWRDDLDFDLKNFDTSKMTLDDGIQTSRYMMPVVYRSTRRKLRFTHAEDFCDTLDFHDGMRAFAFVSGCFIFGDVIEGLVSREKIDPKRITIHTLSVSQENIDSFANVFDMCDLKRLDIVLSRYFYNHEKNALIPYLYETLDKGDRLGVAIADVHSKLILIETQRGNKIVMHGSANMRSSRSVEHVAIEVDADLYDYIMGVHEQIMRAYSTINKAIPAGALWEIMAEETAEKAKAKKAGSEASS